MNQELKKNSNHIPLTILEVLAWSVSARPSLQEVPGRVRFPGESLKSLLRLLSFRVALSTRKRSTDGARGEGGSKISEHLATGLSM